MSRCWWVTDLGGNQRETDRAKAAKKQAALNKSKAKESNTSLAKRKEAYVSSFESWPCADTSQWRRNSKSKAEGMTFSCLIYPGIVRLTLSDDRNETKRRQQKQQPNRLNECRPYRCLYQQLATFARWVKLILDSFDILPRNTQSRRHPISDRQIIGSDIKF